MKYVVPVIALSLMLGSVVRAAEFEVMNYNVENLFDAVHNNGADDWTYLPLTATGKIENCKGNSECLSTDWTEEKFQLKLNQIKDVLLRERGALPDILGVEEIENTNAASQLAQTAGFEHFAITTGSDERGINVALFWKERADLVWLGQEEHVIKGEGLTKPTRNILEVKFMMAGEPISVFVNHWPSQGNPPAARVLAAKTLRKVVDLRLRQKIHTIMLGDFNTIPEDYPHPFNSVLLPGRDLPTHLFDKASLLDLHTTFMKSPAISDKAKKGMLRGSYYFTTDAAWNLLDHFFIDPTLMDGKGLDIDLSTYQIYSPKFMTKIYYFNDPAHFMSGARIPNVPLRYDTRATTAEKAGFSDHFPIIIKLKI